MRDRTKKVIKIVSIIIFILVICLISYISLQFALNKEEFKAWMDAHVVVGRIVFVLMVALQIMVALIPGGPIEMAGGYAFGAVEGTILFIIGATIGSIIVFVLVKRYGYHLVEVYFKKHEIKKLSFLKDDAKRDLIFMILFIIPGTPKDLLCYVAGLTPMKLKMFAIICSLGRLPAVVGSAISGSALDKEEFLKAAIAFALTIVVSGAGILLYYRILGKKQKNIITESDEKEEVSDN